MKYKIKIITGFRKDQEHSIDAQEAHKAYYAFTHPKVDVVFSNGIAVRGEDIRQIAPDYNATMGWNQTYQLTNDDWNELKSSGVDKKLQNILGVAKELGLKCHPSELNIPLSGLVQEKYQQLLPARTRKNTDGLRPIKDIHSRDK